MEDDLYELAGETTWERQQSKKPTVARPPVPAGGTATAVARPKTKVPAPRIPTKPPASRASTAADAATPEPALWLDPAQPVFRDRDIDMMPLLSDIERELRGLKSFYSEEAIRLRIQELNSRLAQQNPAATTPLLPLDADRIISRWRKERGASSGD